jgi:hypothetical protein
MSIAASEFGHLFQGTLRFSLLAAGLLAVLRLYWRSGFLGRLRAFDWVVIGAFSVYCLQEARGVFEALIAGKHPGWSEILGWPVDPLLALLLAEALLLHRSVQRTGVGLIGRCWHTYSTAIALVLVGDFLLFATAYGYLPWPWSSLSWYVWVPAGAAFALAPAYQLEAIHSADPRPKLRPV